jgi:glycosyltransferase involved in cell wall biosynthesis
LKKPKVVTISYSSLTSINRKVYGALAEYCDICLIIPSYDTIGGVIKTAEPAAAGDPPLIFLPLISNNPRSQYFKGIWKVLKTNKPDFIYLENDPISVLCFICCLYRLFYGAKILCQTNENLSLSLKGIFSKGGFRAKSMLILKRITCFFIRPFVDQVFTINYDGKKIFEHLKFKRVSWIPLGYDPGYFHRDESARLKIRMELKLASPTIGYFGRIVPQKGLLLLLKALIELQQFPWKILIDDFSVYTTPYTEEIKTFIKQHELTDKVVFFQSTHEEISEFMNACDLVVVPSITEGTFKEQYGRVVQEAIACGCLTITSDSGFLPNFFRESIFLFRENSVEAIREKIAFFLTLCQDEKERLQRDSMDFIKEYFSINAQAKVIDNAFRQIQ